MVANNNENLLIKVSKNNILHIDPNSILDDGKVKPRQLKEENLTIFVKLEADLQPRTSILANDTNNLIEISSGILNVTTDEDYNTKWTNTYTNNQRIDETNQAFGISDINIINKLDLIPTVVINFVDVRGKTLFESPENSPYKCFAYLPYPIFYLTVKGYYGKPLRLKLHLNQFTSRYNDSNGNFEITTSFVASTYSYFTDIPISAIMYAPYMFKTENVITDKIVNGVEQKRVIKSSRGLNILNSVFNELKQKKLIDQDTQPTTLLELGKIAESLDKTLDTSIKSEIINPDLLANNKSIEDLITKFENDIIFWGNKNINNNQITINLTEIVSLNTLIDNFKKELSNLLKINREIKVINIKNLVLRNTIKDFVSYFNNNTNELFFDLLRNDLNELKTSFFNETNRITKEFEEEINKPSFYKRIFKFKPTLKNVFGILLANAEVYIRLMKDVHNKAMEVSSIRSKYIENIGMKKSTYETLYPWPNIKKVDNNNNNLILQYPGSKELVKKLNSNSKKLWPEVAFIEEYLGVQSNLYDTNTNKEIGINDLNFNVSDNIEYNLGSISKFISTNVELTYQNKSLVDFAYELWERLYFSINLQDFNNTYLNEYFIENEINNISSIFRYNQYVLDEIKKVSTPSEFLNLLGKLSNKRIFSLNESIPTTNYIEESLSVNYKLEYLKDSSPINFIGNNEDVNKVLSGYEPKNYRANLFPFSSEKYLGYLNKSSFTTSDLTPYNNISIKSINQFIETPNMPENWYDNKNQTKYNTFKNNLSVLNTDLFHYQLFNDFNNNQSYVGSAYLLLNSLSFYDLQDYLKFGDNNKILMSSLFREVDATHYIPYYLILKWGSIYHRYKKYKLENKDILGSTVVDGKITFIDDNLLFDNKKNYNYSVFIDNEIKDAQYSNRRNVGLHPYYDAIFHQIINDYTHYNLEFPTYSYGNNIKDDYIKTKTNTNGYLTLWSNIVNNKKISSNDDFLTILPSLNNLVNKTETIDNFDIIERNSYRIIWSNENEQSDLYDLKYPNYNEYHINNSNVKDFKINSDYKQIYDLIGTFNNNVLDKFEEMFLNFANNISTNSLKYDTFKSLLKEIVTIKTDLTSNEEIFSNVSNLQNEKLNNIINTLVSQEHVIKITLINSKDIDLYTLNNIRNKINNIPKFNKSQLTDYNKKLIDLYVGESPTTQNHYYDFFEFFNVEINPTNIKNFKSIILLYAGIKDKTPNLTYDTFVQYIKVGANIDNQQNFNDTIVKVLKKIKQIEYKDIENDNIISGFENDSIKLELYNTFKLRNDKWFSSKYTGEKLLMEDFLFLDSANRDISDKVFVDINNFKDILDPKNERNNLYTAFSVLLKNTNFLIRPMPAYVNFYKKNNKNSTIENMASTIFGTFLEVDVEDTSPKLIIQYTDTSSKYVSDMDSDYYYENDSFYIDDHDSPLNTSDSNVVSFEINIGDMNQNIFKSIDINQSTFQNTSESFKLIDQIARSESGSSSKNMDKSLFDIYRNYNYTCSITLLGNMMIQPTMYFYLNNLPMYRGTYIITEVNHNIGKQSTMTTTIKGRRMAKYNFPLLNSSFVSSYKSLFDRIILNATTIKQ